MKEKAKQVHPDQKYINALVNGESSIIQEIFRLYYQQIEAYVLRNKGTPDDAKDLFNESLKIIYLQGRENLVLNSSFIGYLRTICQRRWINELKRRNRFSPDIEKQQELASEEDVGKNLVEHEKTLLFRRHFNQLPDRCRQILELSFEGLNYREVSEKLDLNYSFVRRRVGECIKNLTAAVKADPVFKELK